MSVTPVNKSKKRKSPTPPSPYSPFKQFLYNGDEEYFELEDIYFDYPVINPIEGKIYKVITGNKKKFKTNKDNSSVLFHKPTGYVNNENEALKYQKVKKIIYLGTKEDINAFYQNGKIFFAPNLLVIDEDQENKTEIYKKLKLIDEKDTYIGTLNNGMFKNNYFFRIDDGYGEIIKTPFFAFKKETKTIKVKKSKSKSKTKKSIKTKKQ